MPPWFCNGLPQAINPISSASIFGADVAPLSTSEAFDPPHPIFLMLQVAVACVKALGAAETAVLQGYQHYNRATRCKISSKGTRRGQSSTFAA